MPPHVSEILTAITLVVAAYNAWMAAKIRGDMLQMKVDVMQWVDDHFVRREVHDAQHNHHKNTAA